MVGASINGAFGGNAIVSLARASMTRLLPTCAVFLLAACGPANLPGAPAAWTGQTSVDPLTDAAVTTATTQIWDPTGSFLAEVTLTCTASNDRTEFVAAAVFFDNQNAGAPLLVYAGGGPQNVAILRVSDLEAVNIGRGNLSANYSNQLFVLNGSTDAENTGDLVRYSTTSHLPESDRLLLKPTLTTGEPVFTINLSGTPVREVFASCAPVFQRYADIEREERARLEVQQQQADLYAPPSPPAQAPLPVPPRREYFQRRAAQAEADCLRTNNVTGGPLDNAIRSMCAEVGASWRRDFVNAADDYARRVQILHYSEFGRHRWAAESDAIYNCGQQYETARRAANTSEAADAAAQAAFDCYVAAGNPPPAR